eukprot:7267949-Pyramimonas_sp.AAC.1
MRQGWRSHGTWAPARQSPRSRKGTLGGTCILRRRHHGMRIRMPDVTEHSVCAKEAHDISIVIWGLKGQDVAITRLYLAASIGFSGENIKKMRRLLQIVRGLGNMPRLVCGGFNHAPQELAGAPWLKVLGGAVVAPQS